MAVQRIYHDFDLAQAEFDLNVEAEVMVQYITPLTDTRENVLADPLWVGNYGQSVESIVGRPMYVTKSNLEFHTRDATSITWNSNVKISSVRPPRPEFDPNPLLRPVRRLKVENTRESVPAVMDNAGRAAANTAGDFFGGFQKDVPVKKFYFSMNYPLVPDWALFLDGCVNSTTITIIGFDFPRGTAKLYIPNFPLEVTTESGVDFYQIDYEVHWRPDGWQAMYWNTGYQQLKYLDFAGNEVSPTATPGSGLGQFDHTEKVAILDSKGEPVKTEQFLDSYGRAIKNRHVSPGTAPIGTCGTTAGSYIITPNNFTPVEDDKGLIIGLRHPLTLAYPTMFVTEIAAVAGTVLIKDAPPWTLAAADVYVPGTSAISLAEAPYADFNDAGIPF